MTDQRVLTAVLTAVALITVICLALAALTFVADWLERRARLSALKAELDEIEKEFGP